MKKYNRIFTIVIDSFGAGAMPDAAEYGDAGTDTMGHISESVDEFHIPNLQKLGIANLHPLKQVAPVDFISRSHLRHLQRRDFRRN